MDLGEREAGVQHLFGGNLGEERVIAAAGLHAALDDVPGDHGAGQPVVVRAAPAEVRGCGPHDHRCVGDPAGDHHVGAAGQAFDDSPGAQVGVRRQRAAQAKLGGTGEQVVAFDVGDAGRNAQALRQLAHRVGQAGRIEAPGVGHNANAPVEG
nr:hypothetical protein CPGR_00948 [Mycolicibacter nonchromogenicus]